MELRAEPWSPPPEPFDPDPEPYDPDPEPSKSIQRNATPRHCPDFLFQSLNVPGHSSKTPVQRAAFPIQEDTFLFRVLMYPYTLTISWYGAPL